jgi:hypothetical protein
MEESPFQTPNPENEIKAKGGIIAVFLGAIATIISIGVFQIIAHGSKAFKGLLALHKGVGPLSGKVVFGYALGLTTFALAYQFLKNKRDFNPYSWLIFLLFALLLGSLFTYTPFVEWSANIIFE